MKFPIYIHIHIHRRLSCVRATKNFSRNTAVKERPFPPPKKKKNTTQTFLKKNVNNKIKVKNKHTFAPKYELTEVFSNFCENLHNFIAPVSSSLLGRGRAMSTICRAVTRLSATYACFVAKRHVVGGRRWYRWIGR